MAGDWIKVEHTLPDKPEVVAMASALGIDQDAVSGKLLRVWVWADQNTVDGNAIPVTFSFLDRVTCCAGFSKAMQDTGWLEECEGGITFRNFTRHNGETAKARGENNRRVAKHRAVKRDGNEDVTPKTLQKPLPEKRREDIIPPNPQGGRARVESPEFNAFWAAYPNKVAKDKARASFDRQKCVGFIDMVLKALEACKAGDQWTRDNGQFIPHPTTWLNQRRWESQLETPQKPVERQLPPPPKPPDWFKSV